MRPSAFHLRTRRSTLGFALGLAAALAAFGFGAARAERPAYPKARVQVVLDTLHGQTLEDPYRWLENGDDPAVRAWTAAENALTRQALDGFPGRAALGVRLRKLYDLPVTSSPQVEGGRFFYSRRSGAQNQPIVFARRLEAKGPGRVFIDPNTLSADGTVALDWIYPSPVGGLVAYGTSANGDEHSTLHVRNAETLQELGEAIPNTQHASVAWDPDGQGFLYTRHPAKGEVPAGEEVFHAQVFHHRLGADPAKDDVIWSGEGRPIQENRAVYTSSDDQWTFLRTSLDWAKNDLYVRAAASTDAFRPVASGLDGTTQGDAYKGTLYLMTNVDAPRYRIVSVDPKAPEPANWKVVVPEQAGVIHSFQIVAGAIAIAVEEKAVSHLLVYSFAGKLNKEVRLPALGAISDLTGDPDGKELYFTFTSFAIPPTVYDYTVPSNQLDPIERGPAGLKVDDFESTQEWATSKDGTRVPVFVVRKKGLTFDGDRPTILSGYGGFDISETPAFRAFVIPWLEAGGVYAQANLRGGGEFGRAWHEAGRLAKKQNVFDDFYAVAEMLVHDKVTRPERLAAQGGSNGGLLTGAALTQRPELFGAIICQVPLLDMIRYHRFSIARYWIPEYGSSEDPQQFQTLLAYSPYQNVKEGMKYPATFFTAAESDARVDPLHARKMTALLQAKTAGDAPILLEIETKSGHGAGKPVSKRIEEAVDILTFLMMRMGVTPS